MKKITFTHYLQLPVPDIDAGGYSAQWENENNLFH
jgi:hypothetical protein